MSQFEIERFAAALKSDAALHFEAEKTRTDGWGATLLAGAVACGKQGLQHHHR
jgi:hypothetical protein